MSIYTAKYLYKSTDFGLLSLDSPLRVNPTAPWKYPDFWVGAGEVGLIGLYRGFQAGLIRGKFGGFSGILGNKKAQLRAFVR